MNNKLAIQDAEIVKVALPPDNSAEKVLRYNGIQYDPRMQCTVISDIFIATHAEFSNMMFRLLEEIKAEHYMRYETDPVYKQRFDNYKPYGV